MFEWVINHQCTHSEFLKFYNGEVIKESNGDRIFQNHILNRYIYPRFSLHIFLENGQSRQDKIIKKWV